MRWRHTGWIAVRIMASTASSATSGWRCWGVISIASAASCWRGMPRKKNDDENARLNPRCSPSARAAQGLVCAAHAIDESRSHCRAADPNSSQFFNTNFRNSTIPILEFVEKCGLFVQARATHAPPRPLRPHAHRPGSHRRHDPGQGGSVACGLRGIGVVVTSLLPSSEVIEQVLGEEE